MRVNNPAREFERIYKKVSLNEQELEVLITDYCTGGNARLSDIDEVFKEMKADMKKIRTLALDYKKSKEEFSNEEDS